MEVSPGFQFDHEKLEVYAEALNFARWLSETIDESPRLGDLQDQLERASSSIALNIAEGNGKYTPKDRCRFFDMANGSALECAAALDLAVARSKLSVSQVRPGKEKLHRIVRMLFGLIKSHSNREYARRPEDS